MIFRGEVVDEEDITATEPSTEPPSPQGILAHLPNVSPEHTNPDDPLLANVSPVSSRRMSLPAVSSNTQLGEPIVGRGRGESVSTVNTVLSSEDGSQSSSNLITHGWGEAPLYTEERALISAPSPSSAHLSPTHYTPGAPKSRSTSGIRSFFSRSGSGRPRQDQQPSPSVTTPPGSYNPRLAASSVSLASTSTVNPSSRHGASQSDSSFNFPFGASSASLLLHPTQTRSSMESRNRLTSPSSLSISAPLADSLVKGSVYEIPKSGLTADRKRF